MYVSGTKKMMSTNCTPVHIRRTQKVHRLWFQNQSILGNGGADHSPVDVVVDEVCYHWSEFRTETITPLVRKKISTLGV